MVPSSQTAPRSTAKEAAQAIAEARCNFEASCNAIGPGMAFGSTEVCMQSMRADAAQELGGNECMDGVADRYLKACVIEATDSTKCEAPNKAPDKLHAYKACRTDSICLG